MEKYITGTGQTVLVHDAKDCEGGYCCIHNPSEHTMKEWPTHWRDDRKLMERICKCGVGHPDPDDVAFKIKMLGEKRGKAEAVHGCCGCCSKLGFDWLEDIIDDTEPDVPTPAGPIRD